MLVTASALDLGYRGHALLRKVGFELAAGDVLAVVGHNGSGKSTFVKTLLGVLRPVAGRLEWPEGRPKAIAYLGQLTEFDRKFPIRVRDLATMGAWHSLGFLGAIDQRRQRLVDDALERTGIVDIAEMPLNELSSGQLQRALFARTMVQNAPLVLLDEPFTAVDQSTEAQLLTLIDDWAREDRAVILVVHDLSAVLRHCTKALLLGGGRALFGDPKAVLTPRNLIDQGYMSPGQSAWIEGMYAPSATHGESRHV